MRSADCRNTLDYSGQKQSYNRNAAFWSSFKEDFILLGHHQHGTKNNPTLGENKCLSQRRLLQRWLCMRLGDSQGEGINHTGICVCLRPGEAMEQGLRDCCRSIRIGKILIQSDEETQKAKVYYAKFPPDIYRRKVLLMYPILSK